MRQFGSVAAALLWYVERRALREGRAVPLECGCVPRSQESRDDEQATYAAIVGCLVARHPADDEHEEYLGMSQDRGCRRREAAFRVRALAEWYRSSAERGKRRLMDELGERLGTGDKGSARYVLFAERVLRRRFEARGLLREVANGS